LFIPVEESSKDIVKKAALAVGSLSDIEFSITFNPDVFQAHVKHAQPDVSYHNRFLLQDRFYEHNYSHIQLTVCFKLFIPSLIYAQKLLYSEMFNIWSTLKHESNY